ncbi:MAG TPA: prepilin-type N-terminal cleavage/methylation domain-containing protein [bacterium]|nr:prepilin-type N-terminal cleavage/methylation domain-containing protein [Candidatus Omnitrophota bacterium]HOJ60464.1 prepilin-type N-terminal cleavage/methylation domain-containing protein [bacterium]HOL94059.1 prepilin-type N-terminal cleavage/methylation domain-containing protein [bacterium]HPP01402.1 prepilin-type N-terminal cleavage/methylation domain-containing protein [bacterium]HXK92951.1 prepilin-type N-terminal cleavage/methylation domain-containing protein [bacterium]
MKNKRNQGFTLIELMTVATIISMLFAIAVPNFLNALIRAKVARSLAEQEILAWALEMYFVDRDAYPVNREPGKSLPGDLNRLSTPVPYVSSIPEDVFLYPANRERHEFVESERSGNMTYFYLNFIQATGQRAALPPYGRHGSANYVVYGLGPSFKTGYDPMIPDNFISYTPSNGTSSDGVLTTFGP